ncbi:VOC family protein [Variovorax terrae]|uniref:VOC family protein n=1 Tax=Variovorax terrae TaxID=2923278 RepID=A0A9X1VU15_9BURK|nr:VOC family protein [Variovorax terrae]MCJ0763786.1 VOC family protein [Variovorax terrae]
MSAGELPGTAARPVLATPRLARALAHYREVLGFELLQEIPGVLGFVRGAGITLQLWQRPGPVQPVRCRVPLDGAPGAIFESHARLARQSRGCVSQAPRLRPWGAWEFSLTDGDGHCITLAQWAAADARAPAGLPSRGLEGRP